MGLDRPDSRQPATRTVIIGGGPVDCAIYQLDAIAARERVDGVAATLDGFELARLDLEQRREGDVLGATQSGRRSSLKLLRLLQDEAIIVAAREEATMLVDRDPTLSAHDALVEAVRELLDTERADYLEKA